MARGNVEMVTNPLPVVGLERGLGPNSVGEALRLLRHRARLTRDALAKQAGVSAGAISNYENDVSAPAAATLRRLALILAIAVDTDPGELWEQLGEVLDRQATTQ